MIETALVFDVDGKTLGFHEPEGRSSGSLPDSRDLWEFLWEHRDILGGVAHTHPWNGPAVPSHTDLTTFMACEQGLGKRLLWPVVTFDHTTCVVRNPLFGQGGVNHAWTKTGPPTIEIEGLEELRERSKTPIELTVFDTEVKAVGSDLILLTNTSSFSELPWKGRHLMLADVMYRAVRVHPKGPKTAMQVIRVYTAQEIRDFLNQTSSDQNRRE